MATWDAADILQKLKEMLSRPESDEIKDAEFYGLLSQGQEQWMRIITSISPEINVGPPTKLTTTDNGETYQFPNLYGSGDADSVWFVELYETERGQLMRPTAYWDQSGQGYVFEGDHIRFPGNVARTFANGPVARYVQKPPDIDAATDPVLKPIDARSLIVTRAAIIWSTEGGFIDPAPYVFAENRLWNGDPRLGIPGIQEALKAGEMFGGRRAYGNVMTPWYRGINDRP